MRLTILLQVLCVLVFCSCLGCRLTPPYISMHIHDIPCERYEYLAMAANLVLFARDEVDPQKRDRLMHTSRSLYKVWKHPCCYNFPRYPETLTSANIDTVRLMMDQKTLEFLRGVLYAETSIPYENDVRKAIVELESMIERKMRGVYKGPWGL